MNAAAASSSGGASGSLIARAWTASRRAATVGAVTAPFIPAPTAAVSSRTASSECCSSSSERRSIEHLDRVRETLRATERKGEDHRRVGAGRAIGCRIDGGLKMSGPVLEAGARFCHSELEQESVLLLRPGRLDEHPTQEHGGRLRRPASRGGPRRLEEPLDDPVVTVASLTSRCSAARSFAPGCSASTRAAARCPFERSLLDSSE